jgi:DNA-binding protein H-NS
MAKVDLDKMSIEELRNLKAMIDHTIERKREENRAEVKKKIAQIAEEHGFSVDEVVGRSKGKKGTSPAKYRNPANPAQTWTGRGRKPGWLIEGLAAGAKLEQFLIN